MIPGIFTRRCFAPLIALSCFVLCSSMVHATNPTEPTEPTSDIGSQMRMEVVTMGIPCANGLVKSPYSTTYYSKADGGIRFIEHVGCDGRRATSVSADDKTYTYQAYDSYIDTDNAPLSMSLLQGGGFEVQLKTAARIRVSNPKTGEILATFPTDNEPESKVYTVPASVLVNATGGLVVVDVIRSSDNSFRGTRSIEYTP